MQIASENPVRNDIVVAMQHTLLPKPRKGWHYECGMWSVVWGVVLLGSGELLLRTCDD